LAISKNDQFDFLIDIVPREEIKPTKQESHSPNTIANNSALNLQNTNVLNTLDQNTANILSAINGTSAGGTVLATGNQAANGNVQYFFALPTNNGAQATQAQATSNGIPLQLQGIQAIQGLPANIQGLQTIQGLQGTQIILSSANGQPALFSVGNRDC
jgi:hypothetical protein